MQRSQLTIFDPSLPQYLHGSGRFDKAVCKALMLRMVTTGAL
jgi:hypothetical protein